MKVLDIAIPIKYIMLEITKPYQIASNPAEDKIATNTFPITISISDMERNNLAVTPHVV